ncbi:Endoglucanase-4 [Arthrobotrys entomopaga]|nr:Endoglucanase-4 [Arthrobotrys entomopaga]
MKGFLSVAATAALSSLVASHSIFAEFEVNGVSAGKQNGLRLPTYDGPITDVTSSDVACNGGPNPLVIFSPNVVNVPAGAEITARWIQTLDTDWRTGLIIDPSHKGPIMVYLNKVSNAATAPIPSSGWFKIWEEGYNPSTGQWAVDRLIADRGYKFKIPTCIAPGNYLMRVELIALHAASSYPGAQLYMECAQINVTGGSGSISPATVNFPGAYSGTDPGIKFNLYTTPISYTIPGPRPITCGGSQPTTIATTTRTTTTKSTTPLVGTSRATTTPSTTTARATTTSSSSGAQQSVYGQCGGIGWTGPTACVSPSKCTKSSDYYSQCLP